jgi:hypothetical protein
MFGVNIRKCVCRGMRDWKRRRNGTMSAGYFFGIHGVNASYGGPRCDG